MTSASQRHPGLPTAWTRVLERNPEALNPEPLPRLCAASGPVKFCTRKRYGEFTDDGSGVHGG